MKLPCVPRAFLVSAFLVLAAPAGAGPDARPKGLSRMPVKEVTVFKDGHAFVLHAGRMATDGRGDVVLDQLPAPVIGTFWPYVAERGVKLASVTASRRDVGVERTALDLRQLVEGNPGASVVVTEADLTVTSVVDIGVRKEEREVERVPNAVKWQGEQYGRVDLQGTLTLTSQRKEAVELEVTRHVLGNVAAADNQGRTEMVNVLEDPAVLRGGEPLPYWWAGLPWPWWWSQLNGVGRVTWTVTLQPGKPLILGYAWNYFWR